VGNLLAFLGLSKPDGFDQHMPHLHRSNYNKWTSAFTEEALAQIGPVLSPYLLSLGYETDAGWYTNQETTKG
jgi:hypothetical protein